MAVDPRRVRAVNGWALMLAVAGVWTSLVAAGVWRGSAWLTVLGWAGALASSLAGYRWAWSLAGTLTAAEEALLRGDRKRGSDLLLGLLGRRLKPRAVTGSALITLGRLAAGVGDIEQAVALTRKGASLLSGLPIPAGRHLPDLGRAYLALVLVVASGLGEAEALLAAPRRPGSRPVVVAVSTLAAALLSLKRGRPAEALETLDSSRTLLQNTLAGADAALAEALEAFSVSLLGGVYRGQPRRPAPVPTDAHQRSWVLRALPDAAGILVDDV